MAVATRVRIIEVAERLFAERGIAAVSLRQIGTGAGQRNNSAATYHFGTKQKLIDAILEYRMDTINARRLAMLSSLDAAGQGADLPALLEALVTPFAESVTPHSYYARFMEQALGSPARSGLITMHLDVMKSARHVFVRLGRFVRTLPSGLRVQRLVAASALFVNALAQHERDLHEHVPDVLPTPVLVSNLVDMMAGLLMAPMSDATRRRLRSANPALTSPAQPRARVTELRGRATPARRRRAGTHPARRPAVSRHSGTTAPRNPAP